MKKLIYFAIILGIIWGCSSAKKDVSKPHTVVSSNDTIRIANDTLEYEVIIIDPGFNLWLQSRSKPRQYYTLFFLENKNTFFVAEWNNRASQPLRYNPDLYLMQIDYSPNIHYGFEVNYLLYNYFIYFQEQYKQKL